MKKALYILSALFLTISCQLTNVEIPAEVDQTRKATLSFDITIPEGRLETKALAEKPQLTSLHVAVFNEGGFLTEYVKATAGTALATENEVLYNYKVSLTTSDKPMILHFIANGPESLSYGSEIAVINPIVSSNGDDLYWQRLEVPSISVDGDGNLVPSVYNILKKVPLVRNFAKITMTSSSDADFTLVSFRLLNAPQKGTLAPYIRTSSSYVSNYQDKTVEQLAAEGYAGYTPVTTAINSTMGPVINVSESSSAYLYEREATTTNPTYVLIYGKYAGDNKYYYYKVSLLDNSNKPFPILRNYNYKINIKKVNTAGSSSWESAITSTGSGDISTSTAAEHLTNISDGYSRLYVEYTEKAIVTGNPVTLKFKYLHYDGTETPMLGANGSVTLSTEDGNVIDHYTMASSDDADGWRTITVYPKTPTSVAQLQKLVLSGVDNAGNTLQRKVSYTLVEKQTMEVACDPEYILKKMGEEFNINITVPGGLPSAMFPLIMAIEADQLSISSNAISVVTSKSISQTASRQGKPSYHFEREITKEEYDVAPLDDNGKKVFATGFKSNLAESATKIYVANEYFNTASTYLYNYTPGSFTNLSFPGGIPVGVDKALTFTFRTQAGSVGEVPNPIYVRLSGLYPDEEYSDNITYDPATDLYRYKLPAGYSIGQTATLHLKTSSAAGGGAVALSALRFNDASISVAADIRIPARRIEVNTSDGSDSNGAQVYLYKTQPSKGNIDSGQNATNILKPGGSAAAKAVSRDNSHHYLPEINLNDLGLSIDDTIWFGYRQGNKYYRASAKIADILNADGNYSYDLTFEMFAQSSTKTININAGDLIFSGGFTGQNYQNITVYVRSERSYSSTDYLDSTSVSRTGTQGNRVYHNGNSMSFTVDESVTTLYFTYRTGNTTYYSTINLNGSNLSSTTFNFMNY